MIAADTADQSIAWDRADAQDPVVQRYRAFFALLDWSVVPERDARRPWPGSPPHPQAAYIKALIVKLAEGKPFITDLRAYLVEHPALVLALGFRPVLDPTQPAGFDVERTVPGARWLRHQQQTLDPSVLQRLLAGTVQQLLARGPELGETIALDVKHIFAWVQENNPKAAVAHRFDPTRQPCGDPDCRLGAKVRSNQQGRGKTFLWGYGTGLVSATHPVVGDVVVAEVTQPFHCQDITYARPLLAHVDATLGQSPRNLAADAAFDAWYVYQPFALRGGMAAIARNGRGTPPDPTPGPPCCVRGHVMLPSSNFIHEDGYRAQRYRCPLRGSTSGCDHPQFARGGCQKVRNQEVGGEVRRTLDRHSEAYAAIYRQRTSAERINSQATALGIERPRVRRLAAVQRLNTLTYLVINLRALQRFDQRHSPPTPALC